MSVLWLALLLFVAYKIYKGWEYNQPQNILDRIDILIDSSIVSLKKAKDTAITKFKNMRDYYEKQGELTKYTEKIAEYEKPISEQFKLHNLITHLREKYKYDTSKVMQILNDYLTWLSLEESYNYTHELLMDVSPSEYIDDVMDDYREDFIKARTIKARLIDLADPSVVKLLKIKVDN